MMVTLAFTFHETLFLEASMSGPDATAAPFVGSDRRSEILDRLAVRARATPPATTPEAIASRVAASIQNQMNEPPEEADEDEGGELLKTPDKDNKDSADRKGLLDGRPNKEEKDDKDESASEKSGDKDVQDAKDAKDAKDDKDDKDKEASDKNVDKDVIDDKNDKDVKDVNDKDKDASDKDDETGTGTFTDDELVDPDSLGQPAETSADGPPADGTGRPASLLTRLPVV
jgi:hypothetical protein